jgi:hypothetical protein
MRAGLGIASRVLALALAGLVFLLGPVVAAQGTGSAVSDGEENASNPLASVNNTDLKYQYFDLGGADRHDVFADGAYMVQPKLKLKYELHYWETNVTDRSESDFERLIIKPHLFPQVRRAWCVEVQARGRP